MINKIAKVFVIVGTFVSLFLIIWSVFRHDNLNLALGILFLCINIVQTINVWNFEKKAK